MIQNSINQMLGTAAIGAKLAESQIKEQREGMFGAAELKAKENVALKKQYNDSLSELEARQVGLNKNTKEYKEIEAKKQELAKTYDAPNIENNVNKSFDEVQKLSGEYDKAKIFPQGKDYYSSRASHIYQQNWNASQDNEMNKFMNEMDKLKVAREKAMRKSKAVANSFQEQANNNFVKNYVTPGDIRRELEQQEAEKAKIASKKGIYEEDMGLDEGGKK